MSGDLLPLAVRAYALPSHREEPPNPTKPRPRRRRKPDPARRPEAILVFDCETTTGTSQALLFGAYRYLRLSWSTAGPTPACVEEGLFHADELPELDPEAFASLRDYSRERPGEVEHAVEDAVSELRLRSRAEFCEQVLWKALSAQATVVGFNLPFDLSRLARAWSEARTHRFEGGFSFSLFSYTDADGVEHENRYRPRILIRPLDAKRARIGLGRVRPGADPDAAGRGRGAFLDLRTRAYALSGQGHSLESACDAFAVPYRKRAVEHGRITTANIDYCCEDVAATAKLYQALTREYERWELQLAPTRAYSPASLAKAYLREAGIRPQRERQPDLPPELLGQALVAYYGGRAECRIRRQPVPVAYLDFASMYPTVCALMGLSRFLCCRSVELVEEDPARVERELTRLSLDQLFDPKRWPELCGFALVQPERTTLPVRARYSPGGSYGIGINPLTSEQPLWYTLADLAAARLMDGRAPKLLRVIRLKPKGRLRARPISVRGSRPIDPAREDLFRALVEERRRLEQAGDAESLRTAAALKVVANAVSYGIFVELNRQEPASERLPVRVHGLEGFDAVVSASEEPGAYFFPPLATLVTGAARLMLALLERCLMDEGGAYAFCDTDSMAIVASESGGLVPCPGGPQGDKQGRAGVPALSWVEVDRIADRFAALNPYEPTLVPGSILELEDENLDPTTGTRRQLHCHAISAKRYCLSTLDGRGETALVKGSEHALGGFYLNPTDPQAADRDWVRESWGWLLHSDIAGSPAAEPAWLDRPALTQFTASHPRLLRPFAQANGGKPYREQIKPFNFLLVAHVAPGGHPPGADPSRFALVAPYESDPRRWQTLPWRNVYDPSGPTYTLSCDTLISRRGAPAPARVVGVKRYRDVLDAYRVHPEAKSRGPAGQPCGRSTIGLLSRRPVQALTVTHIGKETNLLDEIQAGLVGEEGETLLEYGEPDQDVWDGLVVPVLRVMPQQKTAADAGIHRDTLADLTAGRSRPQQATRSRLTTLAATHARGALAASWIKAPRDDLACLRSYIEDKA